MIEISETVAHKFISYYHMSKYRAASVPVDIQGNMAHELAQILLARIISSQGEFIFFRIISLLIQLCHLLIFSLVLQANNYIFISSFK